MKKYGNTSVAIQFVQNEDTENNVWKEKRDHFICDVRQGVTCLSEMGGGRQPGMSGPQERCSTSLKADEKSGGTVSLLKPHNKHSTARHLRCTESSLAML